MVSNDVMRLEVKRLRDTLNGAADEVFSLENRRQQLAMSMKERKAEIQVKKEAFKLAYDLNVRASRHSGCTRHVCNSKSQCVKANRGFGWSTCVSCHVCFVGSYIMRACADPEMP